MAAALIALALIATPAAQAAPNDDCEANTTGGLSISTTECIPVTPAKLVNGKAIAPANAPAKVKKVIKAANKIRNKKYIYGGGHGGKTNKNGLEAGYDCSGSVSFALKAGGFVKSPLVSGSFMNWKKKGVGRWITTYAHGGHVFMVVAGLSFDTSNMRSNGGNRWSTYIRSSKGFKVRHPGNY